MLFSSASNLVRVLLSFLLFFFFPICTPQCALRHVFCRLGKSALSKDHLMSSKPWKLGFLLMLKHAFQKRAFSMHA